MTAKPIVEESIDTSTKLVPFLRNLANSIEDNTILPRQLKSVGEFFMKYSFDEEETKDEEGTSVPIGESGRFDSEEMFKFFVLGWYIYCVMLREGDYTETTNEYDT